MIGYLTLDIDGTLTNSQKGLPAKTIEILKKAQKKGWILAFVTGRMHSLGMEVLKDLKCPFWFLPLNGSACYQYPEKKRLNKRYFSKQTLEKIVAICSKFKQDPLVYTGIEGKDSVYWRPKYQNDSMEHYIRENIATLAGTWIEIDDFKSIELDEFPMAKVYGKWGELDSLYNAVNQDKELSALRVKDSVCKDNCLLQITESGVNKGTLISKMIKKGYPVIAAGDDVNDISLLQSGTIKIALKGSPKELLDIADIVASDIEEVADILEKEIENE